MSNLKYYLSFASLLAMAVWYAVEINGDSFDIILKVFGII